MVGTLERSQSQTSFRSLCCSERSFESWTFDRSLTCPSDLKSCAVECAEGPSPSESVLQRTPSCPCSHGENANSMLHTLYSARVHVSTKWHSPDKLLQEKTPKYSATLLPSSPRCTSGMDHGKAIAAMTAGEHDGIDDNRPMEVHCVQNKVQWAPDAFSGGDITVHGWDQLLGHEDDDVRTSEGRSLLSKLGKSLKSLKVLHPKFTV